MLIRIGIMPFVLGVILIASIVICKYISSPLIFLLVIIIVSILYQRDTNKKNNIKPSFEDVLVNLSKFIIIAGISGYIVVRIIGIFLPGFN